MVCKHLRDFTIKVISMKSVKSPEIRVISMKSNDFSKSRTRFFGVSLIVGDLMQSRDLMRESFDLLTRARGYGYLT